MLIFHYIYHYPSLVTCGHNGCCSATVTQCRFKAKVNSFRVMLPFQLNYQKASIALMGKRSILHGTYLCRANSCSWHLGLLCSLVAIIKQTKANKHHSGLLHVCSFFPGRGCEIICSSKNLPTLQLPWFKPYTVIRSHIYSYFSGVKQITPVKLCRK